MVNSCYNDNSCDGEGMPHCEREDSALRLLIVRSQTNAFASPVSVFSSVK